MMTIQNNQSSHYEGTAEFSQCQNLLMKMSCNWSKRAQVLRVPKRLEHEATSSMAYDMSRDDFLENLLPFADHPLYVTASDEMKTKILSCGWLAYNEKTVDIESQIISPACNHIIYKDVPGVDNPASQIIASDTLVDEAYHIQLVINACQITREYRGLNHIRLPRFAITNNLNLEKSVLGDSWKKILMQIATAIVSEVFISDYLNLLATDLTIQPFNRLTVFTHRQDERAHHSIFKTLARCIYLSLNNEQKRFFAEVLPLPVRWFANLELDVWESILKQLNFSGVSHVINDCRQKNNVDLLRIDYSGITSLAQEIGILETSEGLDSFSQAGLLTT